MSRSGAHMLVCLEERATASARMFMFPFAGGGTVVYRTWLGAIPAAIEPWAVLLPGRESRLSEQPLTDVYELVRTVTDELIPLLDRPFALFGHSMGAIASFEVARELRRRQAPAPVHLVVSGRRAPDMPARRRPLHCLPEAELIDELRRFNGTPEAILKDRGLMELMLPVVRADLQLVETYEHRSEPPLDIPLSIFGGDGDADANLEELQAWARHTTAPHDLTVAPGDHFYLLAGYRQLMEAVGRRVLAHCGAPAS